MSVDAKDAKVLQVFFRRIGAVSIGYCQKNLENTFDPFRSSF
jgi:hypothetical protein